MPLTAVSIELSDLIEACWARDPKVRPQFTTIVKEIRKLRGKVRDSPIPQKVKELWADDVHPRKSPDLHPPPLPNSKPANRLFHTDCSSFHIKSPTNGNSSPSEGGFWVRFRYISVFSNGTQRGATNSKNYNTQQGQWCRSTQLSIGRQIYRENELRGISL